MFVLNYYKNLGFEKQRFEIILEYHTILKWPSLIIAILFKL